MNKYRVKYINKFSFKILGIIAFVLFVVLSGTVNAQDSFDRAKREKNDKKGTNIEYYKNGTIKSVSQYKRKVFWYYTDTYWTIKEYDIEGNLVRMTKKVVQMARRENTEKIIKEEVHNYEPKKDNSKDGIRPEQ